MQQLLTTAGMLNGNSTPSSISSLPTKSCIEDIANRLSNRHNGNGYSSQTDSSSNRSLPTEPLQISNNTPSMQLSCIECGITKGNSEDMEVHIKMEHLNWLPFQCPICLTERASDAQMREHLHSYHNKNMNKFIYVDNVTAKRQLQILMDKALSLSVTRRVGAATSSMNGTLSSPSVRNSSRSNKDSSTSAQKEKLASTANDLFQLLDFSADGQLNLNGTSASSKPAPAPSTSTSRKRSHASTSNNDRNGDLVATNTDSLLASISRAAAQNEEEEQPQLNLDDFSLEGASSALVNLFAGAKRAKNDYDDGDGSALDDDQTDESVLDSLNPISVLDNVAALFGNADRSLDDFSSSGKGIKGSNISKKRVLGECSKCQKPVTAGARQMHMFFHLAKDESIFRFRCKFPGCAVEHYRKDQMENHQSKAHGKIDAEMMEDRSLELFQKCQDLSMELLGTKSGSTPGPTAARAEIAYQAQLAAQKDRSNKSKGTNGSTTSGNNPTVARSPTAAVAGSLSNARATPDDEHPLQCRLCGKTMQNRIRGFHILWHMAKDKGINRYTCKYCDFGHDRSQSVQTHGKKEHNSEDNVEDRIAEYQDDVKEMSEACFGFQALFAQDNRRRSKIPAAIPKDKKYDETTALILGDVSPTNELDDAASGDLGGSSSDDGIEDLKDLVGGEDEEEDVEEQENDPEQENDEEQDEEKDTASTKRKRRSFARFGIRPKKSRGKKEEMAALRNISMLLGGAQYYRKKVNEQAYCEKCGKLTNSRMSEHAYSHMDEPLFLCPCCDAYKGHHCRDTVMKHMRESHPNQGDRCIDNRLKHAAGIKQMIQECYPAYFIDMPLPSESDVKKIVDLCGGEATSSIAGIDEYLRALRKNKERTSAGSGSSNGAEEEDEPFDDDEAVAAASSVEDEMTRWLKDEGEEDAGLEMEADVDDGF